MGKVRHDLKRLEGALRLHPQELMAAHLRTINRTVSHVRTHGVREMAQGLPWLERAAIRGQTKLKLATRALPRASVEFSAKRFRLFGNFVAPSQGRGVKGAAVRLRRVPWRIETLEGTTVSTAVLARAFLARTRAVRGTPNVWIRVGAKRYPITALLASSLATAFRARGIGERLVRLGRSRREIVFAQEMKFRLAKRGV